MVWIMSWSNPCRKWVPEWRTGILVRFPSPATTPDMAAPVTPAWKGELNLEMDSLKIDVADLNVRIEIDQSKLFSKCIGDKSPQ